MNDADKAVQTGIAGAMMGLKQAKISGSMSTGNQLHYIPDVYRAIRDTAKAISHEGISKNKKNEQQGYKFRGIDDVYNALSAILAGADLCILPRMISREQQERTTAKGGVLFYVVMEAEFDFVSARDGSKHTVKMYGEAMDSADKATNKAMSAAYKYACMQVFCIPTEGMDDADAVTPSVAPAVSAAAKIAGMNKAKAEGRPVAKAEPIYKSAETAPILDGKQEPWEDDPEAAMHNVILEAAKSWGPGKVPYNKNRMLQEITVVKKRYLDLNDEAAYRRVLGRFGVQKSDQLPSDDGGVMARAAYKELLWLVGELETAAGKVMQPAAPESPKAQAKPPKDLYDYIDWESATASKDWQEAWIRVGGKVYQLWDGNYKEWKATSAASTK